MGTRELERLTREILGRRLERIIDLEPRFPEDVVAPILEKYGIDPRAPIDRRTRAWREAVKEVRKRAYYTLRRFRPAGVEVPLQERSREDLEELARIICGQMEVLGTETVIDLGSGLFPLTLPLWPCRPRYYIAVERDTLAVEKLWEFSRGLPDVELVILREDLASPGLAELIGSQGAPLPGLGLVLRVLRVLVRTRGIDPVDWLSRLPVRGVVVSEPCRSLVGGDDITRREARFLRALGRRLVEEGFASQWHVEFLGSDVVLVARM